MALLFEKRLTAIVRSAVPRHAEVYLRRDDGNACIYAMWSASTGEPFGIRILLARSELAAYVAGSEQHRELVDERLLLSVVKQMQLAAGYLSVEGSGGDLAAVSPL